jgi:hypothetical protein
LLIERQKLKNSVRSGQTQQQANGITCKPEKKKAAGALDSSTA